MEVKFSIQKNYVVASDYRRVLLRRIHGRGIDHILYSLYWEKVVLAQNPSNGIISSHVI